MKIKFKNQELTRTKVTNNILRVWNKTNEEDREDWYEAARTWIMSLCDKYNYPSAIHLAGITAALSPLKTWEQNKKIVEEFIVTGDCGHIGTLKDKAKEIDNHKKEYLLLRKDAVVYAILNILNGNKIKAFFTNICFPNESDNVTIDRHALSIALGRKTTEKDYSGMTDLQYSFFVECYKKAANKEQVTPLIMQSTTWVYYRKNKYK